VWAFATSQSTSGVIASSILRTSGVDEKIASANGM
jgi:hypothetical protein